MNSPFAEFAARLIDGGYSPIPLFGKRPVFEKWDHLRAKALTPEAIEQNCRKYRTANLGVAGGYNCLVPIDIDTDDREITLAVVKALPKITVAKAGRRGFTAFFWDSTGLIDAAKFKRPKEAGRFDMLVEVLVSGQTVIPPSIHPETLKPYVWKTKATLFDTGVDDLPEINPDHIAAMQAALAPWMPKPKAFTPVIVSNGAPQPRTSDSRMAAYARAILANETGRLAGMSKDSGRNQELFRIVCKVGKFIHHGVLNQTAVLDQLMGACQANGLWAERDCGPKGCAATFASGLKHSQNDSLPNLDQRKAA